MKTKSQLLLWFSMVTITLIPVKIYSQIEEIGKIMAAGTEDAEVLIQPYISPAVNAFGAALSSGWYNTAGTHELGGFDITFTGSTAIVPEQYETFLIDNSALTLLKLDNAAENETPTVAGPDEDGPQLNYNFTEFSGPAFNMIPGLNTKYVPAPMIKAGIGLIKGTEIMARYMPDVTYNGNEIGFWGLGGKHDIKQWIPALKRLPVFQLSMMYGYTRLHANVGMTITPADINADALPGSESSAWDNQSMSLLTQSHTANVLVAANLPVVCFYGGIGFVTTKSNLKLEGDYPSVYMDGPMPSVQALVDPIDMEIKNQDGGLTKPRLSAGVRFKIAVLTIHVDYSWANYSVLSGGLGISFR